MSYTTFSSVNTIIGKVSQDIRDQLSATANPGETILIDYVNRTHKEMLRFSRWGFLLSEPQYFMTAFGQTDYWIGPNGAWPGSLVNTNLNLIDVDKLKKDEVRDFSNDRALKPLGAQPLGPNLNTRSGQTRPSQPSVFFQDWNDPNIIHLWPGSLNNNKFQPQPDPPALLTTAGGALAQRTYYVRLTFVDDIGGESAGSSVSTFITIPAGQLLEVVSPRLYFGKNASNVGYARYNVYAAQAPTLSGVAEGSETLQNVSPLAVGTNFIEPTSGLTTTGASVPVTSTIVQMEGFVIGFRYYKARRTLTQTTDVLQIPEDYDDVIVQGVQYLAWKFLGKADLAQASFQSYQAGKTSIVADKNLFPDNDFIRPDSGSHVNQQILSYLPPFF